VRVGVGGLDGWVEGAESSWNGARVAGRDLWARVRQHGLAGDLERGCWQSGDGGGTSEGRVGGWGCRATRSSAVVCLVVENRSTPVAAERSTSATQGASPIARNHVRPLLFEAFDPKQASSRPAGLLLPAAAPVPAGADRVAARCLPGPPRRPPCPPVIRCCHTSPQSNILRRSPLGRRGERSLIATLSPVLHFPL
jgi:hypothetical protein